MKAIILVLMMLPLTLMSQTYVGKRISTVLVNNPDPRYDVNEGVITHIDDTVVYLFKPVASYDSIYSDSWVKVDSESMIITKQYFSINKLCQKEIMQQLQSLDLLPIKFTKYDDEKYTYITVEWTENKK